MFPSTPHPADLIADLKKEFPNMAMPELINMADARASAEIARRKAVEDAQATIPEGDEA